MSLTQELRELLNPRDLGDTMPEIQSDIINPEALSYLNDIQSEPQIDPKAEALKEAAIQQAKDELLSYCQSFITKSKDWRVNSYENKWRLYQNNCDSIMDDAIVKAKEPWQSKAFVPMTASHKETIQAHIFKVLAGVQPPLSIESRYDLGELDQSDNIRDIIVRELDKSKWAVEFNKVLDDAETFGSGFMRLYFETTTARRKLRKAIQEEFSDNIDGINPMGLVGYAMRAAQGQLKTVGYEENEEDVVTYRGLRAKYCSIWDIFPDPKALQIPGSTIGYRFMINYGDIVAGAKKRYYLQDAADKLRGVKATERYPQGKDTIQADREVADGNINKTDYGVVHESFELFGKFPSKWISVINGEQPEDGEELISARVLFHPLTLLAVEVSDEYDQEAPILKLDYIPVNGEFYGHGVPYMLKDLQAITNEVVNQRLDSGAILLNRSFGVIEEALSNPKQDLKQKPGQFIRFKSNKLPPNGIDGALKELSMNDLPVRAGFGEVNEAERWAQERTSANRVTLGTQGQVSDANQTLGGQKMLKESAGAKFSYVGLLMELGFQQTFFHQVWKIVYKNLTPEDVEDAIGPERAQSFILLTPEEILRDYTYKPLGVFTMDDRGQRQAQVQSIREQFKGAPWLSDEKFFDKICQLGDQDPDSFKLDESEILAQQAGMIEPELGPDGQPMAQGPQTDLTGQPMPGQGQNPMPQPQEQAPMPSPDDIKAMFKGGTISREQAAQMLRDNHGFA